jgi:hypothetical protein
MARKSDNRQISGKMSDLSMLSLVQQTSLLATIAFIGESLCDQDIDDVVQNAIVATIVST